MSTRFTIDDLERIVAERATATDGSSYTASLIAGGPGRVAKKLGEEGVEAALACAGGNGAELIAEAADLVYHLAVALKLHAVTFGDVMDELASRTGQSGLDEKAGRTAG